MKKLYLILASALCASTVFALDNIYVIGSGDALPGWNPINAMAIEKDADGNFSFTSSTLEEFQISTVRPTDEATKWGVWGEACHTAVFSPIENQEVSLFKGSGNIVMPVKKGNYKVTVSGDLKTIRYSNILPEGYGDGTHEAIYIVGEKETDGTGNVNGTLLSWNPADPITVTKANGCYTFRVSGTSNFKMSYNMGSWNEFGKGVISAPLVAAYSGKDIPVFNSQENISVPGKYSVTVVVSDDFKTVNATFDDMTPWDLYIIGGPAGWSDNDRYKFETTDHIHFWLDITEDNRIPANQGFKISNSSWAPYNLGTAAPLVAGNSYQFTPTEDQCKMSADYSNGTIYCRIGNTGAAEVIFHNGLKEHTVPIVSGIDNIEIDSNIEPEYYNMQGIRVDNPRTGMYIKRTGNKVSKVYIH